MNKISKLLLLGILSVGIVSCSKEESNVETSVSQPTIVKVEAIYDSDNDQHLFRTETDTISAGWTTFRFENKSPMVHFLFFDYLPEGKTSKDLLKEVSPVFQESSYLKMQGKDDESMAVFSKLPAWFSEVVFRGGPGFVSPGNYTETTLFMKPGNYVMECYIKTADGTFHWKKGMTKDLRVTTDSTDAKPPRAPTVEITTTDQGLDIKGSPRVGKNLVKVIFNEENPAMIGRDVHVAKLAEQDSLKPIVTWMDFNNAHGLISTAENPGPATFIGGTHEMPIGNTAYFTMDLDVGEYAWVMEQPVKKSTARKFIVSSKSND